MRFYIYYNSRLLYLLSFFQVVWGSIHFRIEAFACDGACAAASILEEFAAASGAEFAASGAEFAAARATAVFSEQGVHPV